MSNITANTPLNTTEVQSSDPQHLWHPAAQMKDYESFKPLKIVKARGSYLYTADGKRIIDAISSWWCKSLGHNHPQLKQALKQQVEQFEHVLLANTTNDTIVTLSKKLCQLNKQLNKVLYAGDGSSAIETALKLSLHSRIITGDPKRKHFLALKNGYHGETTGALSVSDVGLYKAPYESMLFETQYIEPLYVNNSSDPLWEDASAYWNTLQPTLDAYTDTTTALIFEPIIQGAFGMRPYSKDFLQRLCQWAKLNNIHIIADEVMTGIGRTGKMLACDHAKINPDFACLSKGLTSGWMAFSAILTTDAIYDIFYNDYSSGKSFLHSHTYAGNTLAASIACATLDIIEQQHLCQRAEQLQIQMQQRLAHIAKSTGVLNNCRGIGAIVAADLSPNKKHPRLGYAVYQKAVALGALLRPIGNTLYWLPPLNITTDTLDELMLITEKAIHATY